MNHSNKTQITHKIWYLSNLLTLFRVICQLNPFVGKAHFLRSIFFDAIYISPCNIYILNGFCPWHSIHYHHLKRFSFMESCKFSLTRQIANHIFSFQFGSKLRLIQSKWLNLEKYRLPLLFYTESNTNRSFSYVIRWWYPWDKRQCSYALFAVLTHTANKQRTHVRVITAKPPYFFDMDWQTNIKIFGI